MLHGMVQFDDLERFPALLSIGGGMPLIWSFPLLKRFLPLREGNQAGRGSPYAVGGTLRRGFLERVYKVPIEVFAITELAVRKPSRLKSVSYTHLTLPTKRIV